MKTLSLALALGCLFALSFSQVSSMEHIGDPGSIYASVSVPSVSNIVGLMATILPSYIVNNKTFDLEIRQSALTYDI